MGEMQGDYKLVQLINDQLRINQLQIYQLQNLVSSLSRQTIFYLLASLCLIGGLITAGFFIVTAEIYFVTHSVRELLPAICVFLAFGLYQSIKAYLQVSGTSRELRFLLYRQKHAVKEANEILEEIPY